MKNPKIPPITIAITRMSEEYQVAKEANTLKPAPRSENANVFAETELLIMIPPIKIEINFLQSSSTNLRQPSQNGTPKSEQYINPYLTIHLKKHSKNRKKTHKKTTDY